MHIHIPCIFPPNDGELIRSYLYRVSQPSKRQGFLCLFSEIPNVKQGEGMRGVGLMGFYDVSWQP